MPRPPPPAAALTITGKPIFAAAAGRTAPTGSALIAGHAGHAGFDHAALGARLVAHHIDGVGWRADEGEASVLDGARKRRVLGQEAVAGMDRGRAGGLPLLRESFDGEIGVGRRARPDAERLVGARYMERAGVGIGIDGHRPQSPWRVRVRMMRSAISPRLATRRVGNASARLGLATAQFGLRFSTNEATPSRPSSLSMRSAKFSAAA